MTGSRTPGERITFDLSTFKSVVTRQMLVLRMRRQPVAMGVSVDEELPAALVDDGRVLAVDAAALAAMNGAVRRDLEADLGGAIRMLRRLEAAQTRLDACAVAFSRIVYRMRSLPPAAALRDYVEAVADYQALGGVRFCLPPNLRSRLGEGLGDAEAVDALLGPQSSTLWAGIRMRELALARRRASPRHHRLAESFRRGYGYLGAEDVDFRAAEAPEAIAARIAALASKGDLALAQEASRLGIARADARARRAAAAAAFAGALATRGQAAVLVALVVLARALAAHEDLNRRRKMRFLRDLRDLCDLTGQNLESAGLEDFAAACGGGV
jgi:hypothetical protein